MQPNQNLVGLITVLLLGLSVGVGIFATLFLIGVLRPQAVRRGSDTVRTIPGRCLLIGLLTVLVCLAGFTLLKSLGPFGGLPSLALALVCGYWLLVGLTILAHNIGERVQTALMSKSLGSDAMAVAYGAVLLLVVGFLPGVGQVIQLVAIMIGLGAVIHALFARPKPPVIRA